MTLYEVKNTIFRTECENLLLDGLCCSEPIMTKGERGVIDNYFVYSLDRTNQTYSGAILRFGIYSNEPSVAYVDKNLKMQAGKGENDYFNAYNWGEYDTVAYDQYVSSYSKIREFVLKSRCSDEEKKHIRTYVESLKRVVDESLWSIYEELNQEFFAWVKTEIKL